MACGRIDERVIAQVFWTQAFGKKLTPEQVRKMHPLRSLEAAPEKPLPEKSDAVKAAESEAGWRLLDSLWGGGVKRQRP